ncbi:MAG TPA: MraY family glycosyltransferase [Pyrinomonadaceae bacterium]|nr:MraY family glycosyltransferase [Pyrinomonadaceae bacterium]
MKTFFVLFLVATFASLTLTPLIGRLCRRYKLLDIPLDGRRMHSKGVPRLGGVAIYLSCLIALSSLTLINNNLTQSLRTFGPDFLIVLVPATLVLILGVYDDLRGTNALVKFLALGVIAALFYAMGGRIETLPIPFFGSIHLHPIVGFMITVFWLVGIANAFNLIDGMDGLASGAALFSSIVILVISLVSVNPFSIVVTLVLCGALAGFLRYNFNPASIFLGDSGALFIGFLLAALSVVGVQKATTAVAVITPILAFGLPVVDTGVTMARRIVSGRPVFQGDGEHIHHMLLARGWSQRRVVLILYAVCAVFGLLAAISLKTSSPLTGFVLFVVSVAVIIAVGQLRYHEMDELRAGVKRTVGDRRMRLANNIRVRRAGLALSKSTTIDSLLDAVTQMLEFEEFAYARLQLGQPGLAEATERAFAEAERRSMRPLELVNGRIVWCWKREGVGDDDVIGSSRYWCFRLPLATERGDWGWMNLYRPLNSPPLLLDMNYLSGFLRVELSQAAERVVCSFAERTSATKVQLSLTAGKIAG